MPRARERSSWETRCSMMTAGPEKHQRAHTPPVAGQTRKLAASRSNAQARLPRLLEQRGSCPYSHIQKRACIMYVSTCIWTRAYIHYSHICIHVYATSPAANTSLAAAGSAPARSRRAPVSCIRAHTHTQNTAANPNQEKLTPHRQLAHCFQP